MSRKKVIGRCHICGSIGNLSFEHVPPQAAFNKQPVRLSKSEALLQKLNTGDFENLQTIIQQKGLGRYTLCNKCNNNTGAWYVRDYVDWVYQAAIILLHTSGKPTLFYQFRIFPLRVIKQIICMFFSANGPNFRDEHPGLVKFVLDKNENNLDPQIRIGCYYNPSQVSRQTGIAGVWRNFSRKIHVISEISHFPFGYIMFIDTEMHSYGVQDISFFTRFRWNDWKELSLRIPGYDIYTWYPGDFRSRADIQALVKKRKS